MLLPAIQTEVRLTRAELEDIVRPRVRETAAALERSVRSAGLGIEDIDRILLVGGSSRIPLVGQVLREMTGQPNLARRPPQARDRARRCALRTRPWRARRGPESHFSHGRTRACDRAGLARPAACDSAGAGSPIGCSRQHRWAFNRLTGSRSRRSKGAGHRCASPRLIRRRGRRESSERGSTPVAPCRRRRARRGRGSRRCSGVRARWRRERKRRGEDHERPGLPAAPTRSGSKPAGLRRRRRGTGCASTGTRSRRRTSQRPATTGVRVPWSWLRPATGRQMRPSSAPWSLTPTRLQSPARGTVGTCRANRRTFADRRCLPSKGSRGRPRLRRRGGSSR